MSVLYHYKNYIDSNHFGGWTVAQMYMIQLLAIVNSSLILTIISFISSTLGIVYILLKIYETNTVQKLLHGKDKQDINKPRE